jgi:hypothetical protein
VIIEGNLYSPTTSHMISFVIVITRNEYGVLDKEIFIDVSDHTLNHEDRSHDGQWERMTFVTRYLFAGLLVIMVRMSKGRSTRCPCVAQFQFTAKVIDLATFTRHFGLHGFVVFLGTLSNLLDGIFLLLCC